MNTEQKERLIRINGRYLQEHVLTESDFDMVDLHIAAIKLHHKLCKTPQVGDIVEGAYYDGVYPYTNGIIEKINEDGSISICYQPYIPFITVKDDARIALSVSGGPFGDHKAEELVLVCEDDEREFCDWGSCGACANRAVNFFAPVRRWKIPYKWRSKTDVYVVEHGIYHYPIYIREMGSFFNIASFYTMEQLDRFCAILGITYTLSEEEPVCKRYSVSHNFRETKGFNRLEDVPEGCKPMKLLSNGHIVDGFFRIVEHTVELYRPNPNCPDIYKPLPLDEHIKFQQENGIY